MFGLSAAKLAKAAHKILVQSGLVKGLPNDYGMASNAYRKVLLSLAGLAESETSLKQLKKTCSEISYFRFRNNSNMFAEAIWEARERELKLLEVTIEDVAEGEGEEETEITGDPSADSSTSETFDIDNTIPPSE